MVAAADASTAADMRRDSFLGDDHPILGVYGNRRGMRLSARKE